MQAFLWALRHFGRVLSLAKDVVVAVQAVGNYIKASNEEKKSVAMFTLRSLVWDISPLDPELERKLDPVLSFFIELALKLAKRETLNWEGIKPMLQRTVADFVELVAQRGPAAAAPTPRNDLALEVAIAEFQAIERKQRLQAPSAR